jgi:hypothetical protein
MYAVQEFRSRHDGDGVRLVVLQDVFEHERPEFSGDEH